MEAYFFLFKDLLLMAKEKSNKNELIINSK